ncbi:MAG: response regulator [Pseudomonadota bacterium]|nr:response regulator [Pseudomonadota bacterium]
MSQADDSVRYAEPVEDARSREGSIGLLVLLAIGLAMAAVVLALMSREAAEPFVLAILAGLSVIGVFSLFAGAVGILHFGERAARNDLTKAYVDNLPYGALVAAPDGKILYANEAYLRLIGAGHDGAGLVGVETAFSGHARIAEQIFRLARAARQGKPWTEEFFLGPEDRKADGRDVPPRWFRISVRQAPARPGAERRSLLTLWQVMDVSGERRAEADAFEKLQQVIDYVDTAPAGFLSIARNGRVEYLNATLARWLGIDLSDSALGNLDASAIVQGGAAALLARTGEDLAQGETRRLDIDLLRRDGTSLPVRILRRPPAPGDGHGLLHMLVFNRSVEAEPEGTARAAEVRFSRFFHSAPIAIATVDAEGRIGDTNARFASMFENVTEPYAAGTTLMSSLVDLDGGEALQRAIKAAGSGQAGLEPVDFAFGVEGARRGRFYVSPIERGEGDKEAAIVYGIDTTEQRALEMQIAQSQKMQAIGQLAGGIAHDFNNVLTAIIGFSELLLANHRETDPAFQDIMNIKQNANRAAGLVRQLLAFSRQQTLRPQVLQLSEVLTELSILLGRLLGEKISLNVQHGRDLWQVKADLHQFEQVIINLAVNARDAMPEGGKLTIRTANVTESESRNLGHAVMVPGEYVLCEVTDTGTGIPPDVMEKIFDPFFSTKEVGKGTGLGLSTVYGIVKQTGGFIFPESELGRGTAFRIYLPRHIPVAEDIEPERKKPEKRKDLTGTGTVLLVEDEEAVRTFAARALASRGYKVLEAGTGTEALEVMEDHGGEVDLVVSDVVMPEMDGPTLLKELRKTNRDLKIIFISGYAEDAFKKNLEAKEQFVFLPKPFSLKQLAEAVKETLES